MANIKYDKTEPANSLVGISVFVTTILITIILIASYFVFVSLLSIDQNEKYKYSDTNKIDALNQQYQQNLNALKWVDKKKNIVKIPVKDAMNYVVKMYNQ